MEGTYDAKELVVSVLALTEYGSRVSSEEDFKRAIVDRYPAHKNLLDKFGVKPNRVNGDSDMMEDAFVRLVDSGYLKRGEDGTFYWSFVIKPRECFNTEIKPNHDFLTIGQLESLSSSISRTI
jgi:hypothetical protein|tara:strand:- start:266 stop:634 length:369 start_codon:yes stop_codon:yes gene_type:complete